MVKYFALFLLCMVGINAYGQNGYMVGFTTTSTSPFQIKVNNLTGIPAHQVSVDMGNGIFSSFNAGNNIITITPAVSGNSTVVVKVEPNSDGILMKSLEFINGSEYVTDIDLSKADYIQQLVCEDAKITTLDVSNKSKLDVLNISGCENLTTLNFTNSPNLVNLTAEKCTGLTSITFGPVNDKLAYISVERCSNLTTCDLSTVGGLEILYGSLTKVTNYNTENCTKLTEFWAVNTGLTNINLSKNTKLKLLGITENPITELDITKCVNLEWLYIGQTHLTDGKLDLSKNINLKYLYANFSQLTKFDLTKNLDLEYADFSNSASLTTVMLTNHTKLGTLYINGTSVDKLDLNSCTSLKKIDASNCEFLTKLDFTACTVLEDVNTSSSRSLEVLTLNSTQLKKLNCTNNSIKTLDLSKATNLTQFLAYSNKLKFSTIISNPGVIAALTGASYNDQALVNIPTNIKLNTVFTALKSEYLINGKPTTYTWKTSGYTLVKDLDYTENNGEFTFLNVFSGLHCEMTNPEYPGLTLKTTTTKTTAPDNLVIEFSINSDSQPFSIAITATTGTSEVLIKSDAGYSETINISGSAVLFPINPQGLNYKVYSVNNSIINGFTFNKVTASLTSLNVTNAIDLKTLLVSEHGNLPNLDLSNNAKLERLTCINNGFTSLDLSNNPLLATLNCNQNKLTSLDLTNNTKLTNIFCKENQLTSLIINCPELYLFECQDNKLTELDISKSIVLGQLNCTNNRITSLNTTTCSDIEVVRCSNNRLTNLVIGNTTSQFYLACDNNFLQKLDLSSLTIRYTVEVRNNLLTEFILNPTTGIQNVRCENNYLKFSTLPEQLMSATSNKTYSPQALVVIPKEIRSHIAFTNLKPEENVQANATTYKWYTKSGTELVPNVDYTAINGEFTFLKEFTDSVYCTMTNPFYPNFSTDPLTTTRALVLPGCDQKSVYMYIFDKMNTTIKAPDNLAGFTYKSAEFKTPAEQGVKANFTITGGNLLFKIEDTYTIVENDYVNLDYMGESGANCYQGDITLLLRKLNTMLVDSCSFNPRLVADVDHNLFDVIWEYSSDNTTWSALSIIGNTSANVTEAGYYRLTVTVKGETPGSVDTRVGESINIKLQKKMVGNRYWYQVL